MMSGTEDDDVLIRVLKSMLQDEGDNMSEDEDDDDNDHIRIMETIDDESDHIRVIAAIDFGTTYSGFAYAYKNSPSKIFIHSNWQEYSGLNYKTPTVLEYDESFNVKAWGYSALAKRPNKKRRNPVDTKPSKPVEKFKLHLSKMENKPYLPDGLDYKTAITDYLKEMCKVMKDTLKNACQIDFFKQVLIIMTVPAEFDNHAIGIMRECALNAELIEFKNSSRLKFATEPEAAAVNCMSILKELDVGVEKSFMIVDCGGGTVDLTTRKLLEDNKLGEMIKSKGGNCGGSFVDDEFIKFLGRKVGQSTIDLIRDNHYGQLQYMVQEFCRRIKYPFTGKEEDFKPFDLDLEEFCPIIKQYVKGSERDEMEDIEWVIELKFEDVKKMFDPVIKQIINLINEHFNDLKENNRDISAMLLVGGFSESKYLREEIKKNFNERLQNRIFFPEHPIKAVVEGAVQYGLKRDVIATRVLKWTYGTDVARDWKPGDPENRKLLSGKIVEFSRLIECGKEIPVDTVITKIFTPGSILQKRMGLDIYVTEEHDADFCDSPGVNQLGSWSINLPITLSLRPILFSLIFGEIEINAIAVNLETGRKHKTTFKLEL